MAKKHRPKRGVVRKQGNEVYFAYVVLGALCVVLALYLMFSDTNSQDEEITQHTATESQLSVEPPVGDGEGGSRQALNQSLQSSESGQQALQGSVNSQSSSVGTDQLQPSTGKEEYETYENQ